MKKTRAWMTLVVGLIAGALASGAVVAYATGSTGTASAAKKNPSVTVCVTKKNVVRGAANNKGTCPKGTKKMQINGAGPQGPPGATGPAGVDGGVAGQRVVIDKVLNRKTIGADDAVASDVVYEGPWGTILAGCALRTGESIPRLGLRLGIDSAHEQNMFGVSYAGAATNYVDVAAGSTGPGHATTGSSMAFDYQLADPGAGAASRDLRVGVVWANTGKTQCRVFGTVTEHAAP